tara:strand:- start:279 stop:977 length:699 start_codon:yes stop_codon:yes gene_type:complete
MTLGARAARIRDAAAARPRLWLGIALGFPLAYYALMFAALVIRFQAWPNYAVTYDWLGNVAEIIRATPAVTDMGPIIAQEWLFEIGRMNYDFGNGISEWSLNINPAKVLVVCVLGALIATLTALILTRGAHCSAARLNGAGAAGGLGAVLVAMTNVTLAWVVCCATPSWVVGLAILGLGVSTSLWLEQFGWWIEYAGFVSLAASLFWLSGNPAQQSDSSQSSYPQSAMGAPR